MRGWVNKMPIHWNERHWGLIKKKVLLCIKESDKSMKEAWKHIKKGSTRRHIMTLLNFLRKYWPKVTVKRKKRYFHHFFEFTIQQHWQTFIESFFSYHVIQQRKKSKIIKTSNVLQIMYTLNTFVALLYWCNTYNNLHITY